MDKTTTTKKKVTDLKICTWNVLSLYKARALKMLIDQLQKYKTY